MNNSRSILIDNYHITHKAVEKAYQKAKADRRENEVVAETFRMMNLNKLYESNPGDASVKMAIKSIADAQFMPKEKN